MNECPFRRMMNNTPTETEAKGFSRRWTYRTGMISEIDILIHQFPIMINRVDGYSVGRAGGFHSPAQTTSALRTVLDSNPSHGSLTSLSLGSVPKGLSKPHLQGDRASRSTVGGGRGRLRRVGLVR